MKRFTVTTEGSDRRSPITCAERVQRYHQAKARFNRQTSLVILILGLVGIVASSTCFVVLWMWGQIVLQLLSFLLASLVLFVTGLGGFISGNCVMKATDEIIAR